MTVVFSDHARARFEDALVALPLEFLPDRAQAVEWAAFPSLVGLYWQLARVDLPPHQDQFVGAVVEAYGEDRQAVRARASRAYPSLVRQHHFGLVLRERFPLVLHDESLDHHGVDLLVSDGEIIVGLALDVGTADARAWRMVKAGRHPHRDTPVHVLELALDPDDCLRIGRFWLHPPQQVEEVEAFLWRVRMAVAERISGAR